MAAISTWLNIDGNSVVSDLQAAAERLDGAAREAVLDFESVRRIDSSALQAMEGFADIADKKTVKVGLHGVNVDVYKVLKLMKLTRRFSFVS
jgi:anti-anti-sigma regulatory factor